MTPTPPEPRHRKNAAEWLMWVALQPVRWFLLWRSRRAAPPGHPGAMDGH